MLPASLFLFFCFTAEPAPPVNLYSFTFLPLLSVMANNHPAILSSSISWPLFGPTFRNGHRPSMASAGRRTPLPPPLASFSPGYY
jgi:hypothetical protein